jgi:class 3 adenylate cyclase
VGHCDDIDVGDGRVRYARNGEVLASRTVRDLSAGSSLVFDSLGPQRLKGLPEDMDVYRVTTR